MEPQVAAPSTPTDRLAVRDRFLSEFALNLAEGADLPDLLARAVREIARLLELDRVTLFLRETDDDERFHLAATHAREGVPPFPPEYATLRFLGMYPTLVSGRPLVAEDVTTHDDTSGAREVYARLGTRSLAILPITTKGRLRGFLSAASLLGPRRFPPEDVAFLESAVRHIAAAVQQMELVERLGRAAEAAERSMREARALAEASRSLLTRTAQRDVLLKQVIDALGSHFGAEYGAVLLVDKDKRHILEIGRHGPYPHPPERDLRVDGPGLIAWAVRNRLAVNVPDVRTDTRYLRGWPDCVSELVVPLVLDGEVLGAFDLQSSREAAFREEHERMLTAFADRAVLALRVSELVAELEGRTRVLEGLARATKLLNFRLHAPDVLSSFVEETSRAFPSADGCVAWVADDEGKTLAVAAAYGLGKSTLAGHGLEPTPADRLRCAGRALREDRPVLVNVAGLDELLPADLPPEERARIRTSVQDAEFRQLLAAPIRVGDRRLGVIEVLSRRPDAFSAADFEVLVLLAEQAAIALRNARLIEELQRSSRLKDDFLANLSHEVRTPLTGIIGWAEVLLDARGDDPQTKRATSAILGQAESLSRMLTDLIDLSRIDHVGLDLRRTDVRLAEIIASAQDAVSPGAEKRGVRLVCEVAPDVPVIDGDPGRLKQVVWNLLANAVKFSPSGSDVTLTARRTESGDAEMVVADRGYGIDPAFLPYVFERFRQEETSTNRRFGGLGVGLSIVRAVVQAHGGTIVGQSDGRGRGARFTVTLPAGRHPRPPSALIPRRSPLRPPDVPPAPAGR